MKYAKPSLTFEQQADLLIGRGLIATQEDLINKLKVVSYYRLSAYWYPFRQPDDRFKPGTTIDLIWQRYTFDRQLRLLTMDAIERVEITVRTQLVFKHSQKYGPFGYIDSNNLPKIPNEEHLRFLDRIRDEAKHSREDFVQHFFAKYTSETDLPLWMACELMTFGNMFTFFRGMETDLKQSIAAEYGLSHEVLESWLRSLNQVRNYCAHHGRLWNRVFGLRPLIPRARKHLDWHKPITIVNDRVFCILTILCYLLKQVAPQSDWKQRLLSLLDQYKELPRTSMGFPENWESSPIWK